MKIGTLTFHRTTNYGAAFQTFALQRVLVDLGVDTEVIDYRAKAIEDRYKKRRFLYLNPKNILKILIKNSVSRDNLRNFFDFSEKFIRISKNSYGSENFSEINKEYDAVIVGSDQVWNGNCMNWDKNFFLTCLPNCKRYAYAASFGVGKVSSKEEQWYRIQLEGFSKVSVRERTGQNLYHEITGKDCEVVLDPTLLLRYEWYELAEQTCTYSNYILVYLLAETPSIFRFSKELAKKTGKKIIYINDRIKPQPGITNLFHVSPGLWLRLFLNASYVVTNSFHGTAFSINFNIPFWVELLPEPSKVNSRIIDLLKTTNLDQRIITDETDPLAEVDFSHSNEILKIEKDKSLSFLSGVIEKISESDE